MSPFAASARAYRAAIRKHEFSEPQGRIVDVILFYSLERPAPRFKAIVPKQLLFGKLCKLSKAKISEEMTWLETQSVIERETIELGRARWTSYALQPPEKWRVPLRVPDSQELRELEAWLEKLDPEQADLIAPPTSLNYLLREDFVERAGSSSGAGDGGQGMGRVELGLTPGGSPAGNFVSVETKEQVPVGGTSVEPEAPDHVESPAKVPLGGTLTTTVPSGGTAPVPCGGTPSRASNSNRSTRVDKEGTLSRLEYSGTEYVGQVPPQGTDAWLNDGYVREKLSRKPALSQELINGVSPSGRKSLLGKQFGMLWAKNSDEAKELLSISLTKGNANSWLNTSVRVALGLQPMPLPSAGWIQQPESRA